MPTDPLAIALVVYWLGFSSAALIVILIWRFNAPARGTEPEFGRRTLANVALPIRLLVSACCLVGALGLASGVGAAIQQLRGVEYAFLGGAGLGVWVAWLLFIRRAKGVQK